MKACERLQAARDRINGRFHCFRNLSDKREPRLQGCLLGWLLTWRNWDRKPMMFLLRIVFWLTIVLVLLPSGKSEPVGGPQVAAGDAMSAATATLSDLGQFCARQPDACTVGSQAVTVLGHRAQTGAKMVY